MTTAIVLAAGGSSRFGSAKQLALFDGQPLVRFALKASLDASLSPVLCVVGAHSERVAAAIEDLNVEVCLNSDWRTGLSSSIACGVGEAIRRGETESVTVLLGDQPRIDQGHLRALERRRLETDSLIAATDDGAVLGVPAAFDASCFAALQSLAGDRGASQLIRQSSRCVRVPLPAALTQDVDTQDELAALLNRESPRDCSGDYKRATRMCSKGT